MANEPHRLNRCVTLFLPIVQEQRPHDARRRLLAAPLRSLSLSRIYSNLRWKLKRRDRSRRFAFISRRECQETIDFLPGRDPRARA